MKSKYQYCQENINDNFILGMALIQFNYSHLEPMFGFIISETFSENAVAKWKLKSIKKQLT